MAEELAYALITPYSLLKSRTGGIIGRLLSLAESELVAARMLTPSGGFVDAWNKTIKADPSLDERMKSTVIRYLNENLRPENRLGRVNRAMCLLFRGENAVAQLKQDVVGPLTTDARGDCVRGTHGEFVAYPSGEVVYFEPAVLAATGLEMAKARLTILADFAEADGGVLEKAVKYPPGTEVETTLVMIKPDLLAGRSALPGNIIDMFSRTGLFIIGAKVIHLSMAQAIEFYGPLREIFIERLKFLVEDKIRTALWDAFLFSVTDDQVSAMADVLKDVNAETEFNTIIEYMTGVNPSDVDEGAQHGTPGTTKCLALLYQGEGAIAKIRDRLGPTDPSKAPGGSVRRDYGADLMRNGAHASDSVESAERERKIVGLAGGEPSDFKKVIDDYLAGGS